MSRPDVIVEQKNGNLGRVLISNYGTGALVVSGVAVADQFALGDVLGPFKSPQDAQDKGIDAAYDTANSVLAFEHIRAFYSTASTGTNLYVMVVANTVLQSALADPNNDYLAKICSVAKDIKIGIITRVPDAGYVPTYDGQLEDDILLAVTKAQELINYEKVAPRHRRMQVVIEGRNYQGNATMIKDVRSLGSDRVTIAIGSDNDVSTRDVGGQTPYLNYAFAGYFAGIRAGLPVSYNAGRVKNGSLLLNNPGLSDGQKIADITESQLELLNDAGVVFAWQVPTKSGWYINDDHVCVEITSDYSYSPNGRVADKVSDITRAVYIDDLLDTVEVDSETGGLSVSVTKSFQERLENVLTREMVNKRPKEASKITVYVNPLQNVLATDKIEAETTIIPLGTARTIKVTQSFENPFNK